MAGAVVQGTNLSLQWGKMKAFKLEIISIKATSFFRLDSGGLRKYE